MGQPRLRLSTLLLICGLVAVPAVAEAQQQQRPAREPAKAEAKGSAETRSDAQLRGRIEQLEEQLADMQVVIGTLESLARGGRAGPAATAGVASHGGGGGVDGARIDSLETQIRALASQMEQLQPELRQLPGGGRRGEAAPVGTPRTFGGGLPSAAADPASPAAIAGFGSTTVTPGSADPIGRILGTETPQTAAARQPSAPLPPAAGTAGNPRELYETAYGYLLQQDYGAAQAAFEDFMRRFPNDRLAADAQYWLGETLYVQRRYKQAGQAFLGVVENHKDSSKVPNSLLKLAQSLEQLGQKDCGIFVELESRHPGAPADVKVKARSLKQRQGC